VEDKLFYFILPSFGNNDDVSIYEYLGSIRSDRIPFFFERAPNCAEQSNWKCLRTMRISRCNRGVLLKLTFLALVFTACSLHLSGNLAVSGKWIKKGFGSKSSDIEKGVPSFGRVKTDQTLDHLATDGTEAEVRHPGDLGNAAFFFDELVGYGTKASYSTASTSPLTLCTHDDVITDLYSIRSWALLVQNQSQLVQHVRSRSQRVFIAGLLKNNCDLMLHYSVEILKFLFLYATATGSSFEGIFVSLYESSSDPDDCTVEMLQKFQSILAALHVPHVIQVRGEIRFQGQARIDFLQDIRNAALVELYLSNVAYDEIVYLSDTFFCASDVIRLLRHENASIKCGLDLAVEHGTARFYDTWVAHDITGSSFSNEFPFVQGEISQMRMKLRNAFQVSSCWNGLTILRASVFKLGARFRRSLDVAECHAAETELICRDFRALGQGHFLVDPQVTVTYSRQAHLALRSVRGEMTLGVTLLSNTTPEDISTVGHWLAEPSCDSCAPLDGHEGNDPDRSKTFKFNWFSFYEKQGVPVAKEEHEVTLHDCETTFASSCKLSRGVNVPFVAWNISAETMC